MHYLGDSPMLSYLFSPSKIHHSQNAASMLMLMLFCSPEYKQQKINVLCIGGGGGVVVVVWRQETSNYRILGHQRQKLHKYFSNIKHQAWSQYLPVCCIECDVLFSSICYSMLFSSISYSPVYAILQYMLFYAILQ